MRKLALCVCCGLALVVTSFAQIDTIANPQSIEKIPYYEQLYRFRIWREIFLKEKQNAAFNSEVSGIANFLLRNIQNGNLAVYEKDSLTKIQANPLTINAGAQKFEVYDSNKEYPVDGTVYVKYAGKIYTAKAPGNKGNLPKIDSEFWDFPTDEGVQPIEYTKTSVASIELVEDMIFDKRRSRLYYDILAIGVWGLRNETDEETSLIGYVSYKDFSKLVDAKFRSKDLKERGEVLWRNRYNPSESKNFVDAFKLRLFHGVIKKVENPDDETITKIITNNGRTYGESVFARWEEEMKLMEKEHNLWEY
ncbi:MAG: hypothetical protein JSU09_16215 [Bacteroidetes bacterium]|nr:hypothetical protein [Bacteroidota bacterium]